MTVSPERPDVPPRGAHCAVDDHVWLRDGSQILIRPIEPRDKEKLLAGFEELSPLSRYRRFFTPATRLDPHLLRYLTEVDHHDHEALIAESVPGEPVGVARYIRLAKRATAAEMAVTVVDHWQGRGVATALLTRLSARAQAEGITSFHATCLGENRAMIALLRELGSERSERTEGPIVEIDLELPAALERGNELHSALGKAASGELSFRHPRPRGSPGDPADQQ